MDTENLENALNGLIGLRKSERENNYKRVATLFHNYLKKYNYTYFYRDLLKGFFSSETKPTTLNRIVKDLLGILIKSDRISPFELERLSKPFLRVRELNSIDYGSYKTLMARNGYHFVGFYKWVYNKDTKTPKKKLVDVKPLGVDSEKDFDFSVLRQTKPRSNQVCLSNSEKSIVLNRTYNKINAFKVN